MDWEEVRERIEEALGGMDDVRVIVFEPSGGPARGRGRRNEKVPNMTPGRAALVGLMQRYLDGLLDPSVTLLEVHKLMYFMEEAGEPLRLRLSKGYYGPYAENLRHVLSEIEGYYVTGHGSGGDEPDKTVELVPGAVKDAHAVLDERPETNERFERVAELVEGFESPFGLELLATVHWVVTREGARSPDEVIQRTYEWGSRKEQFTERQILLALEVLKERGWVGSEDSAPA